MTSQQAISAATTGKKRMPVLLLILCACGVLVFSAIRTIRDLRAANAELARMAALNAEIGAENYLQALKATPRYSDPLRLSAYESRIFSQNGEDGIILEILRRIGATNRYFIEFGSAGGYDSNTALLLKSGWRGLWIDGNEGLVAASQKDYAAEITAGRLISRSAFITAGNIEQLFASAAVPPGFDVLSIDIDRNDYWVWKAIRNYRPRVVVIEYNSIFPPGVDWVVAYDPKAWWDRTSHFGASLKAMERLGAEKGYSLVGCNLTGSNAFFVQTDLAAGKFSAPYTAENHYEPARYFLSAALKTGHPRSPAGAAQSSLTAIQGPR